MNTALSLLILTELVLFSLWVFFAKNDKKKSKDLISGIMFLVALVILYQVFKLNLDFGLVLSFATLFAAVSWAFGKVIALEELQAEGRSYFLILLVITCIRSFAYEPYQIPSRSMVPGLQV